MNSAFIQMACANYFGWWKHFMVPNIYLGPTNDEMDIAVLTKNKILWEIEIKISIADWRNDSKKDKWKYRSLGPQPYHPARFYYAVPLELVKNGIPDFVIPGTGIIAVPSTPTRHWCKGIRVAKAIHRNKLPQKYIEEMYNKISRRYWNHVAPIKAYNGDEDYCI